MNNSLNNLSKTLLASAVLTLAAGSTFAESLGATGTVAAGVACSLKFITGANTYTNEITLPTGTTTSDLGLTVGYPTSNNNGTEFTIKAEGQANGSTCDNGGTAGVRVTQFNTTFASAGTLIPLTAFGSKAPNTEAAANAATGVTIDLVPKTGTRTTTGLNLAGVGSGNQHGQAAANLATGQVFTAKYIKTTTAAATAGKVTVAYTVTAAYN